MKNNLINVVGAGPAGLTAAITAAKAGYDVNLYEQNSVAGQRFNSDFQGLENWSDEEDTLDFLNRIGIDVNFLCQPYMGNDGVFYGPNLKKYNVNTSRALFYLIERGSDNLSLDTGLTKQAIESGVNIIWNHKLESVGESHNIVGTGPKAADAIAKGIVFKTSCSNTFIAFLNDNIAPKGYAYLLICNGKATFATCLFEDFRNAKIYFKNALIELAKVIDIDILEPKEFGGFINFFEKPVLIKNKNVLYVGENAGLQDALWGFGIKYDILSGYLAVQSIINQESYVSLCERYILPKFRTSIANRWLFAHLNNFGYSWLLNKLTTFENVIPILIKHHNQSFSKKIVYQIAKRWYHTRLIDKNCIHKNCSCVWCRHGDHIQNLTNLTKGNIGQI